MTDKNFNDLSDEEFEKQLEKNIEPETEENDSLEDENNFEEKQETEQENDETTENGVSDEEREEESSETTETKEEVLEEKKEESEINYKEIYEDLVKPFKADGKEIKLDDPRDLIQLAQKGVNYDRKMRNIKPQMKIIKSLENNDLLDAEKINFLIDISRGNKEALEKHIKSLNIDPVEFNIEEENTYKSNNYIPSDEDYDKNSVIEDHLSTVEGKSVITTITQDWDNESQLEISENPDYLDLLVDHQRSGLFEKVNNELLQAKLLGRIPKGITTSKAYATIANSLLGQKQEVQKEVKLASVNSSKTKHNNTQPKINKIDNTKIKALSSAKSSKTPLKTTRDVDLSKLSDEEYLNFIK